jgi:hypothetical protein
MLRRRKNDFEGPGVALAFLAWRRTGSLFLFRTCYLSSRSGPQWTPCSFGKANWLFGFLASGSIAFV